MKSFQGGSTGLALFVCALIGSCVFVPSRSFASLERCASLLAHALTENDPKVIEATLLHALSIEHPVLFQNHFEDFIAQRLAQSLHDSGKLERIVNELKLFQRGDWRRHHVWSPLRDFDLAKSAVRLRDIEFQPEIDRAARGTWEDLRSVWLEEGATSANQFARPSEVKRYDFPGEFLYEHMIRVPDKVRADTHALIQTIDSDANLKERVIAVIAETIYRADEIYAIRNTPDKPKSWLKEMFTREVPIDPSPRAEHMRFLKKYLAGRENFALPSALPPKWFDPERPLSAAELADFDRAFDAPANLDLLASVDGLIRFDADIGARVNAFSTATVRARDEITFHPDWTGFYEATGNWLRLGEKPEGTAQKLVFLTALDGMQTRTLEHSRVLQAHRNTIARAERSVLTRLRDLNLAPAPRVADPIVDAPIVAAFERERGKVRERLESIRAELASLQNGFEKWTDQADRAEAVLRRLRESAPPGRAAAADPKKVRASMRELQNTLDLDATLNKRIEEDRGRNRFFFGAAR